jgi:hypothetical protein
MPRSNHPRLAAAILLALAAIACSNNDTAQRTTSDGVTSGELCVSSSCGEKIDLLDLPSAENLIFTPDGRLFVSAGVGVVEVTKDGQGAFHTTTLSDASCTGSLGLAVRGDMLYAVCQKGIYAGAITATPHLTRIFDLVGMCIPNGMALGGDGNLYVVDEPLSLCVPDPKIVRLNIDPADPMHILSQETWVQGSAAGGLAFGVDNVLRFPNGLTSRGNTFFGTDGGSVYRVDLMPDGTAGEVLPLFWEPTAHDDLGIAGDDLTVADFAAGRIFLLSQSGVLLQETDRALWVGTSCARVARGPMFEPGDILVTSQGVLTDENLPLDKLSVFRRRK